MVEHGERKAGLLASISDEAEDACDMPLAIAICMHVYRYAFDIRGTCRRTAVDTMSRLTALMACSACRYELLGLPPHCPLVVGDSFLSSHMHGYRRRRQNWAQRWSAMHSHHSSWHWLRAGRPGCWQNLSRPAGKSSKLGQECMHLLYELGMRAF